MRIQIVPVEGSGVRVYYTYCAETTYYVRGCSMGNEIKAKVGSMSYRNFDANFE